MELYSGYYALGNWSLWFIGWSWSTLMSLRKTAPRRTTKLLNGGFLVWEMFLGNPPKGRFVTFVKRLDQLVDVRSAWESSVNEWFPVCVREPLHRDVLLLLVFLRMEIVWGQRLTGTTCFDRPVLPHSSLAGSRTPVYTHGCAPVPQTRQPVKRCEKKNIQDVS